VPNPWRGELQRVAGLALLGILLGLLIDSVILGLLLVLAAYLAWHLYNIFRLVSWLREGKKFQPPEASGIWDDAFEQIFRLQQRNRKRKHNLRRMLKRFHKITVALPDATVELRPGSDEIEWWNNAASRYLGFRYPRDTGQRISNLIRYPQFLAYLHTGDWQREVEMPSPVNEEITLRVRVISYSKNRRLLVARDVTRIQRLERTRQDFVANVSHELRSPLTVVTGYLETLLDNEEYAGLLGDQLRSMRSQTERMNRIVASGKRGSAGHCRRGLGRCVDRHDSRPRSRTQRRQRAPHHTRCGPRPLHLGSRGRTLQRFFQPGLQCHPLYTRARRHLHRLAGNRR